LAKSVAKSSVRQAKSEPRVPRPNARKVDGTEAWTTSIGHRNISGEKWNSSIGTIAYDGHRFASIWHRIDVDENRFGADEHGVNVYEHQAEVYEDRTSV
jgi:hypothetical protein